jgi:phage tail-like protein
MRLQAIVAVSHPAGNRIDLSWGLPTAAFPGVRVVRREGSHPTAPDDGVVVAEGISLVSAADSGLKGETVYYYALFRYRGDPREYDIDRANRVAALATAPHDHAGQMYALLPAVYHRYDTKLPETILPTMAEADRRRGQLRRFLELPGAQLDLLHSFAKAALDLHDVERAPGDLLPLLAGWIGWNTDHRLEIEAQRNEIRHAPFVYRTVGLKPAIEATVKRISGWESRSKEFVHNVFRSNAPERLNLWVKHSVGADWGAPAELLSLDYAYQGRPAAVRDGDDALWLFHHAYANRRREIRAKRHDATDGWAPSQPLPQTPHTDNQHPAAARAGGTPWVFWVEHDATTGSARLVSSLWNGSRWSEPEPLPFAAVDPRAPSAIVDHVGNVWLFWLERVGQGRQLRYSRHDGAAWGAPLTFPLDAGAGPRVEADPFVLFDAVSTRIWVLWSRATVLAGDQTRREIAWRVKSNADFDAAGWSGVNVLPRPAGADYHDREPAARLDAAGRLELYFSSNRGAQGYGVWRSVLTDAATNTWDAAQGITQGPYAQHAPLAVPAGDDTWLIYRSNESLSYPSAVYGATVSTDFRYAGSTTADVRNADKIGLRGAFEDFATYTYDAGPPGGRGNDDWYARDTVGLYLEADTLDAGRVSAGIERLRGVLGEFMPITDRAVFITAAERHDDHVYTYAAPGAETPRFIVEHYGDALTAVSEDAALAPGEDFSDALE